MTLLAIYLALAALAFGYAWVASRTKPKPQPQPQPATTFRISPSRTTMNVGDTIGLKITLLDPHGNPAAFDPNLPIPVPAWAPIDPSVGVLAPAADGMTASFTAAAVGTDPISATIQFAKGPDTESTSIPVVALAASTFRIDIVPPTQAKPTP